MNFEASPTGRPGLFAVMRDAALEAQRAPCPEKGCPYPEDYCRAQRAAELWHRAPEEWELERVPVGRALLGFDAWLPSLSFAPLSIGDIVATRPENITYRVVGLDPAARTMTISSVSYGLEEVPQSQFFGIDRNAESRFTLLTYPERPPRFRAKPSRVPAGLQKRRLDGSRS